MTDTPEEAAWRPREENLRKREVNQSLASTVVQSLIALAAVVAVGIAAVATISAGDAIDVAKRGIQTQADENRLSTAADAIAGDTATARVAGLTLLRRHTEQRLANATDDNASASDRRDALSLYRGTVEILATYLKTPTEPSATLGIGDPHLGPDSVYAANDLKQWLKNETKFRQLSKGDPTELPNLDLARAELYGVPWANIDFGWLSSRYLVGVDLRLANLNDSNWGKSEFTRAHLGCAQLERAKLNNLENEKPTEQIAEAGLRLAGAGPLRDILKNAKLKESVFIKGSVLVKADLHRANLKNAKLQKTVFKDANLSYADLTGAKLNGADLTNANLTGADITGADFTGAILNGIVLKGVVYDSAPVIDDETLRAGAQRELPPAPATPEDPAWDPACTPEEPPPM
jgi:uncharacterized protein YjbI with pentapeptide repeats